MYNTGYPTAKFDLTDISGASSEVLYSAESDGLNVPFQFILSERGVPGQIYFGGAAELYPVLGSNSFAESSPYFTPATRFIGTQMAGQGVCVMPLRDPTATVATLGVFLEVVEDDIVQYTKDELGARIVDEDGNYVPETSDGNPVTEPGIKAKWTVRVLANNETFDGLAVVTQTVGQVTTVKYPIIGLKMAWSGKAGNRQGFALYSAGAELAAVAEDIKSAIYRFAPVALATDVSTTAGALLDTLGSPYNDVSFKDVAVYSKTATNYAFKSILGTNYVNAQSGSSVLPYEIHTYGANIATVGQAVLDVSPELEITDPYLIDLISGADTEGLLYDHLEIDEASSTVVNEDVVNYALGGADGEVSFTKLQELIRDWCEGSDHGEFTNLNQWPITHFSDPGFTLETKYAILNMLDLRDNLKIDLSTQDVLQPLNTKAQDMSAGQALLFRAQQHPQSILNGVGCMRVGIYAHAGKLVNGTAYSGVIPFNLNRAIQRRDYDGGQFVKGSAAGMPNSKVEIFVKANWTADDESVRKLAWGSCINVVMHASRTELFYPSLRTVYPNDTSLLSDDEISDRVVYMYKIARQVWAQFAGVRKPSEKLFPRIEKEINDRCALAFSGDDIGVRATVFETAMDANLGYAVSIKLAVSGNMPKRQMNFNVEVARYAAAAQ